MYRQDNAVLDSILSILPSWLFLYTIILTLHSLTAVGQGIDPLYSKFAVTSSLVLCCESQALSNLFTLT